jgi:hypothetical protein
MLGRDGGWLPSAVLSDLRIAAVASSRQAVSECVGEPAVVMAVWVAVGGRRFRRRALDIADAGRGCGRHIPGRGAILAADSRGVITAGWTASEGGSLVVRAADLIGTKVGPAQTLSAPGRDAVLAALAAGPGKSRLAVWTEHDPGAPVAGTPGPILAAVRGSTASAWTGPETLTTEPAFPDPATTDVDPVTGRAFVLLPTTRGLAIAIREPIG